MTISKKILASMLGILTFLLLTPSVNSQNVRSNVNKKSDEEQIREIDKMKKEIKANLNSYKKIERFADDSGSKYFYTKHRELQLIKIFSKDQHQNLDYTKEWYFHNGQLIYAEQIITERTSNGIIDKEKFYLDDGRLSVWIQSKEKVDRASPKFKKAAEELPDYVAKLIKVRKII